MGVVDRRGGREGWRERPDGGGLGRLVAATALLLASGCAFDFSEYWEADDELDCAPGVFRVKWNDQERDDAAFCGEIDSCQTALGLAFDDEPAVEFVTDPVAPCLRDHVAGCFAPDFDHIYLMKAELIADTPLCHELLHRALYFGNGDPDYGHVAEAWRRIP